LYNFKDARSIIELIKNPKPEIYTNPASADIAKAYYSDVAAFEENMFKG
jgi:hypothetical protein